LPFGSGGDGPGMTKSQYQASTKIQVWNISNMRAKLNIKAPVELPLGVKWSHSNIYLSVTDRDEWLKARHITAGSKTTVYNFSNFHAYTLYSGGRLMFFGNGALYYDFEKGRDVLFVNSNNSVEAKIAGIIVQESRLKSGTEEALKSKDLRVVVIPDDPSCSKSYIRAIVKTPWEMFDA
jgi:hypothetical protein